MNRIKSKSLFVIDRLKKTVFTISLYDTLLFSLFFGITKIHAFTNRAGVGGEELGIKFAIAVF